MFDGKRIMVTGATSGIGRALCTDLLARGAHVFATGRDASKLADLERESDRVKTIRIDLTEFAQYEAALKFDGKLDGLVCSAGMYQTTLLQYFPLDVHELIMRTNLTSPLAVIAHLQKKRLLNRGASIVLISSILGPEVGLIGSASYAASKAALVGCTKSLALELARSQVRINCVSPGMVETKMTRSLDYMSSNAIEADRAKYPLGKRYAKAEEVTAAVRFLLSDEASFITGTNLIVDGGCSAQ